MSKLRLSFSAALAWLILVCPLAVAQLGALPSEGDRIDIADANQNVQSYTVVGELGRGGEGVVFEVFSLQDPTQKRAIKVFNKDATSYEAPLKLIQRIQPSLPGRSHLLQQSEVKALNILHKDGKTSQVFGAIGEVAYKQTLDTVLPEMVFNTQLTNEDLKRSMHIKFVIMQSLIAAVQNLSTADVVHRDLKPQNVFFQRAPGAAFDLQLVQMGMSQVLVGDFGLACAAGEIPANQSTGTLFYMAPETILYPATPASSFNDLYSLGAMLFEIEFGVPPVDFYLSHQTEGLEDIKVRLFELYKSRTSYKAYVQAINNKLDGTLRYLRLRGLDVTETEIRFEIIKAFLSRVPQGRALAWQNIDPTRRIMEVDASSGRIKIGPLLAAAEQVNLLQESSSSGSFKGLSPIVCNWLQWLAPNVLGG